MNWVVLAEDIASRVEQEEREELLAEAADLADAERATQTIEDRVRGMTDLDIAVAHIGMPSRELSGTVRTCGAGWFLVEDDTHEHLVMSAAVTRFSAGDYVREAAPGLRVSVAAFLRELQGSVVTISCVDGSVRGTIMAVGKDHIVLDQSGHAFGSHARPWTPHYQLDRDRMSERVVVAFSAIAVITQARVNRV